MSTTSSNLLLLWRLGRPKINWSFIGSIPSNLTFTRASTGTYFDAEGVLQTAAIDAPRFDHDPVTHQLLGTLYEGQRTNSLSQNMNTGAVLGVIGSCGALPTRWTVVYNPALLTTEIVGTGTEQGLSYVDVKISGTAATTTYQLSFQQLRDVAASTGEVWTASQYAKLVSGSLGGITEINTRINEQFNSTYLGATNTALTLTSSLTRFTHKGTLAQATTNTIAHLFSFTVTVGAAIDATVRLAMPQFELGTFASSVIPTTTATVTRATDNLTFTIPAGVTGLRYTFDNDSTQDVVVSAGSYIVPTTLNRTIIKRITSI